MSRSIPTCPAGDLQDQVHEWIGGMDIYLLDQVLKGRLTPGTRVLDAGCGDGRNLAFLLRCGYQVHALDRDPLAIDQVRKLARRLAPELPEGNFRMGSIERLSAAADSFDTVICCAVLHFSRDDQHFGQQLEALWRVLRPGGLLFARLASTIGVEEHIHELGNRRYRLGDGSERYLVDEPLLRRWQKRLGAHALDPLKTVQVEKLRAMSTWCLQKADQTAGSGGTQGAPGWALFRP